MTEIKIPLSLIAAAAFFVQSAFGAIYYVDYAAGLDASAGTSSGAAWKHLPGDPDATGNAASATLAAGDTVALKGGVTYVTDKTIEAKWSGSSGSYITYDFSGSAFGSGKAIITTTNAPISAFAFTNKQWLKFYGGMVTNVGGYDEADPVWTAGVPIDDAPGGTGFYSMTSTNIWWENVILSEIGQWSNNAPMDGTQSVSGTGINLRNSGSNMVVRNCEFTRMHTGIQLKGDTVMEAVTIHSNYFHNFINWCLMANPSVGGTLKNFDISWNRFLNAREFDNNRWGGTGDSPHSNKIFLYTAGFSSTWTNINIHHNWFIDDDVTADGGTGQVFIEDGASANVVFNVFSGRASNAQFQIGGYKKNVPYWGITAFNNSFHSGSRSMQNNTAQFNGDTISIFNNIFYRITTSELINTVTWNRTNMVSDRNVFFSNYSPISNYKAVYTGGYRNLASWQSFSGQDANSALADPLFTDTSGDPTDWDLRLEAGSEYFVAGTNLYAELVALGIPTVDMDGLPLPSSGAWPVGAYSTSEGVASGAPLPVSATVASDGATWSFTFDRTVTSGTAGENGMTATMSLGSVTLTYSSGKGTDTLVYTGSPMRYAGETGTASYTQPGNGIEGSDGTDLATFSGLTVVNNSSQQQPAPSGSARSLVKFKGLKIGL